MPAYPGFIGSSNQLPSLRADVERLINLYVENDPVSGRPALYSVPGQRQFAHVSTDTDVRALFSMNTRTFAVVGTTLAELFAGGTFAVYGAVIKNSNPAQIVLNGIGGNQALVASGNNAYSLNLGTNVLSAPVLTGEARQIGMLDGYGVALNPLTGKLRLSDLNDFATWDPTQFALRSSAPDNWQALLVSAPDLWLIGEQTGDIWFDAGTSPFPFAPRPGATFRYGIAAPFSLLAAGDSVFWLARNADGIGEVVRARGYVPQAITSYALSVAIARYAREFSITDAEASACTVNKHLFYVLSFPSANATWAYDIGTGLWSEWGQWNSAENRFDIWFPRVMCQAFGKQLVGGTGSGVIAELDDTIATELDGGVIRRIRIPPALQPGDRERLVVDRLELGVDAGVGLTTGQGSAPLVMLRVSHDFGHNWSSERTANLGAMGAFGTKVFWTRCGSSDVSWLPELSISDPVPWRLTGAQILGSGFGEGF
jgi:hypothetical protein